MPYFNFPNTFNIHVISWGYPGLNILETNYRIHYKLFISWSQFVGIWELIFPPVFGGNGHFDYIHIHIQLINLWHILSPSFILWHPFRFLCFRYPCALFLVSLLFGTPFDYHSVLQWQVANNSVWTITVHTYIYKPQFFSNLIAMPPPPFTPSSKVVFY